MQSGMPVTITQATNNNAFAGFSLQRPNLVANPALPGNQRTPAHFFNTAAFATARSSPSATPAATPSAAPPTATSTSPSSSTPSSASAPTLEFRAELFNLTNTPAFAQPNGSFGSAAFGTITATTTDPRVLQLALRLSR